MKARSITLMAVVGLMALGVPGVLMAEVGALDPGSGPALPDILGSVTDDPDPFSIWLRYRPDGNGRSVLNDQGYANQDGPPSMLFNPAGPVGRRTSVAWARNSQNGYDVVISSFLNGAWSTPDVIAGDTAVDEHDPHLFLDPATGAVHLVYWIDDGATRTVWHRQAPADLSSWSAAEQVSASGDSACRPSGVFHGSQLYVAYEVHDYGAGATPRQVVLARREGSGGFTPEVVAITQYGGINAPQVHSKAGRLWVDWIDSETEAGWIRSDGAGGWEPVELEPYANYEEREYHVRGAIRMQAIQ